MKPKEYAKAFLLNSVFYAVAIIVYIAYGAGQPGGVSPGVVALLVVGSVVLIVLRLRGLNPIERRLRFKDQEAFLQALDNTVKLKDRWELAEEDEAHLRYTARMNYGLYVLDTNLEVTLTGDVATLVGIPRVTVFLVDRITRLGIAAELG